MRSIEERIVDMQFNNKQFENGIQTSLKSLDSLDKELHNTGKNGALSSLQAGVESVANKFSALGIMGVTALVNITNQAINTGLQMIKSLTIEPVQLGLNEYELKMGSIQTIMASTGASLRTVNAKLDELNKYSDRTIYSFSDMTQNIGKFTNAGVKLNDAVLAIQGVSNAAAVSGANANEASRAMYNFAQALSAGYVKLIDWKSIENANMATVEFKNQLIASAVAAGTLKKTTDGMYRTLKGTVISATKNFNESLQDQWMTTETLIGTLKNYADETTDIGKKAFAAAQDVKTFSQLYDTLKESAQSGWAESFQLIIGDFNEAKKLWTEVGSTIGGIIDKQSDERNKILQQWKQLGGREAIIQSFRNTFSGLLSVIKPVKEAFTNIFPPITGKNLKALSDGIKTFTERLTISDQTAEKLKKTFSGLFAAIDLIGMAFSSAFQILAKAVDLFIPLGDGLLSVTADFGDFMVALRNSAKEGNFFGNIVKTVTETLTVLKEFLNKVGTGINEAIKKISGYFQQFGTIDLSKIAFFTDRVEFAFKPFTFIASVLKSSLELIISIFQWAWPIIAPVATKIGNVIATFASDVATLFTNGSFRGALDLLNAGLLGTLLLGIKKFVDSLSGLTSGTKGILGGIKDILDGVRGSLEAYQQNLKSKTLLTIAAAIALLAASLLILASIDGKQLTQALMGITVLFIELVTAMSLLQKSISGKGLTQVSVALIGMSAAILILSFAMKNLASLDWDGIVKGAVGVGVLSAILIKSADALSNGAPKMIKGGVGMIAMATAVLILTQSVKQLSAIDFVSLAKGVAAVGVIMAEIAAFTQIVKPQKMIGVGLAMIAMGAALKIVAGAVGDLGKLSLETLIKGLTSLSVVFLSLATFTQLVKPDKLISTGIAMSAIGAALLIISQAIQMLGTMNTETLYKGLVSIGAALISIDGFTRIVNTQKILTTGIALIAFGAALLIISKVVQSFGGMSWEQIAKGMTTLAGSLLIVASSMYAMSGGLAGAAAMLVMATAIGVLAPSLLLLGKMNLTEIGLALLALVGVFAVVGAASAILSPLIPVILGLGVAISLLGVGVLSVGVGLLAFSAGLSALAISGTAGAAALVIVVTSLISLIPMILQKLGEGIITFATVIKDGLPAIIDAVRAIGLGLIQVLVEITPPIVSAILTFLVTLLDQLADAVPKMVESGMRLLLGILEGISEHINDVVVVALTIMVEFLKAIASKIPDIVAVGVSIVASLMVAIGQEVPKLIDAGFKMIVDFINGLAQAIRDNAPIMGEAMGNLAGAMIDGLVNGLLSGVGAVVDSVINLGKSALDGIKNFLGIHSPSREFETLGEYTSEGFVKGISSEQNSVVTSVNKMSESAINAINAAIPKFQESGTKSMDALIFGLNYKLPDILLAIRTIIDKVLAEINLKDPKFIEAGKRSMTAFATGLAEKTIEVVSMMRTIIDKVLAEINIRYDDFFLIGQHLVDGFINGIESKIKEAAKMAAKMAAEAMAAAQAALGINSPSKEFARLGKFSAQGFANGINHNALLAVQASENLAESALFGLKDAISNIIGIIDSEIDTNPTIRPVLDLSDIQAGSRKLNDILGGPSVRSGISLAAREMTSRHEPNIVNQGASPLSQAQPSISFVQNNYSPKALSRLDIYRQTRNQFSAMKGVLSGL